MRKAVYIWILLLCPILVVLASEPLEISSISSPEFVLKDEPFTVSAKIYKPQSKESVQLYLHANFDVSLKSVELNGVELNKQLRFYRVDVATDLDKVYKIESGQLEDNSQQIYQINLNMSSTSSNNIDLYLTDAEDELNENIEKDERRIKIYENSNNSGKALQLNKNAKVSFNLSTDDYDGKNLLIEFWTKLKDDQEKFLSLTNEAGNELTSLSVSEFGYLSIPNILDAEFFDELYIDQQNWNYFFIKLNTESGKIVIYLNDEMFFKGICDDIINQNKLEFALENISESKPLFERLKIWSYNNASKLALLNKNFNVYSADSSSIIYQNNFDTDNSIEEINYTGQIQLVDSDAPIFSRAPNLNVALIGQSYNLSWEISDLANAQKFVIEKSYDARNYMEVTTVQVVDKMKTLYSISDYDYSDNQIIYYRIKQVNTDNTSIFSSDVKVGRGKVKHFELQQNYPNPFNPVTTVSVEVKKAAEFEVEVYDIVGKSVAKLYKGPLSEGIHRFSFDGTDLPSGLYLCEIKSNDELEVMKMILAK